MSATAEVAEKSYIIQRALKITTLFNEHLNEDCEHCRRMLRELYNAK